MRYKVEVIVEVPDHDQDLMTTIVPRAIIERFRGTAVNVLEIRFQDIQPHMENTREG